MMLAGNKVNGYCVPRILHCVDFGSVLKYNRREEDDG